MSSKIATNKLGLKPMALAGSILATAAISVAGTIYVLQPATFGMKSPASERPTAVLDPRSAAYSLAERSINTWELSTPKEVRDATDDGGWSTSGERYQLFRKACSENKLWREISPATNQFLASASRSISEAGDFRFVDLWDKQSDTDYFFAVDPKGSSCAGLHKDRREKTDLKPDTVRSGAAVLGFAALISSLGSNASEHSPDDETRPIATKRLQFWRNRWTLDLPPEPAATNASVNGPLRMSTADFYNTVRGETKEGVRQRLGVPSNVIDQNYDHLQNWYYWRDKLQLFDADAGTTVQGNARVTFSTDTGAVVDAGF